MLDCGIDAHKNYSLVSTIDEEGTEIEQAKLPTTEPAMRRHFDGREPMRIVLESGTDAAWLAGVLEDCGHEVIVAHARRIKLIAESKNKTDRIDAELLARLLRADMNLLCESYVRGQEAERIRTMLKARKHLVECRTKMANAIRGLLRKMGHRLPSCTPRTIPEALSQAEIPDLLKQALAPLGFAVFALTGWIDKMDQMLEDIADEFEIIEVFTQICGVGTLTALAYMATIEDPYRFESSKQVGAYFGMCPSVANSGNEDTGENNTGRITKQGDEMVRSLLVQAAHTMLRDGMVDSELRQFGKRIEAKKGKKKAAVALGRKLSKVMHKLWVTGRDYEPFYHQNHHGGSAGDG